MYRNEDTYGIYGTLSMQAALQLYLPHVQAPDGPDSRPAHPDRTRRRVKRIHFREKRGGAHRL